MRLRLLLHGKGFQLTSISEAEILLTLSLVGALLGSETHAVDCYVAFTTIAICKFAVGRLSKNMFKNLTRGLKLVTPKSIFCGAHLNMQVLYEWHFYSAVWGADESTNHSGVYNSWGRDFDWA